MTANERKMAGERVRSWGLLAIAGSSTTPRFSGEFRCNSVTLTYSLQGLTLGRSSPLIFPIFPRGFPGGAFTWRLSILFPLPRTTSPPVPPASLSSFISQLLPGRLFPTRLMPLALGLHGGLRASVCTCGGRLRRVLVLTCLWDWRVGCGLASPNG